MERKKKNNKHALSEYERKYGRYLKTGLIGAKSTTHPKGANKYWLIDGTYYPIPTFKQRITLGWGLKSKQEKRKVLLWSVGGVAGAATIALVVTLSITLKPSNIFKLSLESNDSLELTNTRVVKNTTYSTDFKLKKEYDTFPSEKDVHVYIDNVELSQFNYIYHNNGYSADLTVDGKYVTGNIKIVAEGKKIGFYNTDWSTINSILSRGGIRTLKKQFNVDSFVGLTHPVEIDGNNTDVIVIGERQDSVAGEYRDSTSLTFAFTDLDALNIRTTYNANVFGEDEYSFTNSLLRSSSSKLFDRITDVSLANAIKSVNKSTADYYKTKDKQLEKQANYSYDITHDKIFPLSLKEMGGYTYSTKVYGKEDSAKVSVLNATDLEFSYDCENNCYELFKNPNAFSVFKSNYDIWTRTPCLSNNHTAFKLNSNSEAHASRYEMGEITTEVLNFIPAFAIGSETSFESDSWENVLSYANQGFDCLKEVYGLNTFVGREKKIEIGGEIYRVRVIGENHDILSNTQNKEAAALTFEFTRAVDGLSASMESIDPKAEVGNWSNSRARKTLNDEFIKKLPDCLKDVDNGVRTVDKYSSEYYIHKKHADSGVVKTNDKIFILSRKEIGAADYKSKIKSYDGEYFELQRDPYVVEGDTYKYYLDEYSKYPSAHYSRAKNARIKGFGYKADKYTPANTNQIYVLRSINPTSTRYNLFVDNTGEIRSASESEFYSSSPAFPCFCIGKSNVASFEFDSWENLINNINKGENEFVKAYGQTSINDFVGKQRYIDINKDGKNESYRVRVIGINHDSVASSGSKALLTFEFIRSIKNEVRYSSASSNTWSISDLRYLCNNELFNSLPDAVKNGVKTVTKSTFREDIGGNETTTERLFPLSAAEIGTEGYTQDGTTYDFYNIEAGTYLNAERIKAGSTFERYYLRSAVNESGYEPLVYTITEDGVLSSFYTYYTQMGVAPAFAI